MIADDHEDRCLSSGAIVLENGEERIQLVGAAAVGAVPKIQNHIDALAGALGVLREFIHCDLEHVQGQKALHGGRSDRDLDQFVREFAALAEVRKAVLRGDLGVGEKSDLEREMHLLAAFLGGTAHGKTRQKEPVRKPGHLSLLNLYARNRYPAVNGVSSPSAQQAEHKGRERYTPLSPRHHYRACPSAVRGHLIPEAVDNHGR